MDPFFFHKKFPPFSRPLAPFLLCSSAYLTPVQISRLRFLFPIYFVLIKSSHSSSSSGPWVRVLACGTFTDFRLYKKTQMERKEALGKAKAPEKTRGKARSWMGMKEGGRFSRETVSLFISMKTQFQLNCSSSLCKQNSG